MGHTQAWVSNFSKKKSGNAKQDSGGPVHSVRCRETSGGAGNSGKDQTQRVGRLRSTSCGRRWKDWREEEDSGSGEPTVAR